MAEYNTSNPLIGGPIVTIRVPVVEDEYFIGMPLIYDGTPDQYKYGTATLSAVAIENLDAAAGDLLTVAVAGSQIMGKGMVDDSNEALTVTADIVQAALDYGIVIRN